MRKQRLWFLLAVLWAVVAGLNAFEGRSWIVIGYNAVVAVLYAVFGLLQPYCDKMGARGEKLRKGIAMAAIASILLLLVVQAL